MGTVPGAVTSDQIAAAVAGQTIPRRFLATVGAHPDRVALRTRAGDGHVELTFAEYADAACRLAGALADLDVGPGTRVVLLLRNRPEFHLADVACLLVGATPISIYNSSSAEQIRYVAAHCRAELAIVEGGDFLDRMLAARDHLPELRHVIAVDDGGTGTVPWTELLTASPVDLDRAAQVAEPDDLVTVIYTSGTTGDPKGVMLDHTNVCWTIESLQRALDFSTDGFRLVSYLPMAHIAERAVSHYSGITFGYRVTTCPDLHVLAETLRETEPQMLFGVPRTYEKIHSAVRALLAVDTAKEAEFDAALAVGLDVANARARGEDVPAAVARAHEDVDAATLRPVRELLGLDAVQVAVTAAAPIPVAILDFFRGLGLPLSEMYGLSETTGPATWEPTHVRAGTVGHAIPGMELRLGDEGEVQCRGGNVFRGYLDDAARTAEALDDDGWLHTGDIGELGDEGYLRIVDRKKELIITAGGKNISPANLESALKAQPLIGQACAIGDDRPYIVALLVLDADVAPVWAARRGVPAATIAELARDREVLAEVAREVELVNHRVSRAESIRRFRLLEEEWQPDSEELTPTMKLKRRGILAKYADEIDDLYDESDAPSPGAIVT
ncbi:MAG TPA: long-chain fatty acid--CoA ligase [Acidimicrobiia bacterium]